jgi:hypothetical protein
MKTRFKIAAGALAALPVAAFTSPAEARVDPSFDGGLRYTVAPSTDWETMSNLTMRQVVRVPGYGWRAGFCVVAGNRYDAGAYYGFGAGRVVATAIAFADGPAGPCTTPAPQAKLTIETSPIFVDWDGSLDWLANHGCDARGHTSIGPAVTAEATGGVCAAPTFGPHFRTGGYSVSTVIGGQVFPDQPSSSFNVQWANWPARRV